jgi:hypothetical protein
VTDAPAVPTIRGCTPKGPSAYYRVDMPLRACERLGLARLVERKNTPGNPRPASESLDDVLVLSRNFATIPLQDITTAQTRGTLVVADEDDSLHRADAFAPTGNGFDSIVRDDHAVPTHPWDYSTVHTS